MSSKIYFVCFLIFALLIISCQESENPIDSFNQNSEVGSLQKTVNSDNIIPGQYIVVFTNEVSRVPEVANEMAQLHAATLGHVYEHSIKGFSAKMSAQAAENLAQNPNVKYIEQDRIITLSPPTIYRGKPGGGGPPAEQTTPWGITRVGGGISSPNNFAWIIDTGIDLDNPDLNVDVARSRTFVNSKSPDDDNGHGTHVAGTIAAINNNIDVIGVAPGATVVAVKVLDRRGSGTYSGVIAGVEYVAANADPGDVANMSLGGPVSTALDDAVIAAADAGIKFSLAAGNESENADNHSPARAEGPNIYTVSAFDDNDYFAYFSNYGAHVDYAAPGVGVLSLKKGGGTVTYSGTSMAAPHVAGLLLLGSIHTNGTVIGDPDGNPDPIAHN